MSGFHILIAGCGPGGAFAAAELLRLGHAVTIVSAPRRRPMMNGLSERCLKALNQHGFNKTLEISDTKATRTAYWGGSVASPNAEYIVDRGRFDAALVEDIRRLGARVITSQIRKTSTEADGDKKSVRINYREGGLSGDFLVEARGRRTPVGEDGRTQRGPATVALTRAFHGCGEISQTAAGSFKDGWWWVASPGTGRALLQFFVDAERADLHGRKALEQVYADCRDQAPDVNEVVPLTAEAHGPVWAFDATPMLSAALLSDQMILCGDAAHTFDPLSGHGIFQAMGSGLAAAAVVNTMLHAPENTKLARSYYRQRCEDSFLHFARVGRDFYRTDGQWPEQPFWQARCQWPDDLPSEEGSEIKTATIKNRLVVEDGIICDRPVIVTPDQPRGVRMIARVAVPELLENTRKNGTPDDPSALAKALNVTPKELEIAFFWLCEQGLLDAG